MKVIEKRIKIPDPIGLAEKTSQKNPDIKDRYIALFSFGFSKRTIMI
ncbi:MAG: hypothetical protein ABH967_01155 [Patescibacteria group bacterium]